MTQKLGQIVLFGKHSMSHDFYRPAVDVPRMSATAFESEFRSRTKEARVATGLTQEGMAQLLGLDQGTYKQYETRSMLPHQYVEKFLLITGRNYEWLFTGKTRAAGRRSVQVEPAGTKMTRSRKKA